MKWEYKTIGGLKTCVPMKDSEVVLNQLGAEGWELVSMDWDEGWAWLKRPVKESRAEWFSGHDLYDCNTTITYVGKPCDNLEPEECCE